MHQWTGSSLVQVMAHHLYGTRGHFKNTYELLNVRALKFSTVNKINIFQCMGKIFCVEFQRYPLNSTQNILPIHWKIWFLYNIEILRVLRFKSLYEFLKRPPCHLLTNADLRSIPPWGKTPDKFRSKYNFFSFKRMYLKILCSHDMCKFF